MVSLRIHVIDLKLLLTKYYILAIIAFSAELNKKTITS